ncbi:MAG: N-acetylglucosamine-6-phosphate deacetylase [Bacillaceae bacterium]|nr:MAG: N-acetylglucosamine-6-phosphate deacetylase [Bacillaceae bacterium]
MSKILLSNMTVYAEERVFKNGYVLIENGKILDVGPQEKLAVTDERVEKIESKNNYAVIPGFIDLHIHGAAGADTMDGTDEAIRKMAAALPREGTTSFLATTMTSSEQRIEEALINVRKYMETANEPGYAEVLGVHLEGPFISPKRAGAQHSENILEPNLQLFKKWQHMSGGSIKLVTLAPERKGGIELTDYLKQTEVVASIGHSDASYAEAAKSIQAGITHATHLFNGMSGLHHRKPGAALAVLMHDEVLCEIIADGIHVCPEMVKFAYQNKGNDGLILITDAMRAKCLGKGIYELGGQEVRVNEDRAVLRDGTLAGSILKLNDAAKNMMAYTGCTLQDIIQMAAVNPAKQINVYDRKGSIAKGKDADLVVLNDRLDVVMTFCRGKLAYSQQEM